MDCLGAPSLFPCHQREAGIQRSKKKKKKTGGMCFQETSQAQLEYVLSTFGEPLDEALKSC